jgi:hypothetical protein
MYWAWLGQLDNNNCKCSSVENSDKENRKWQDAPSSPTGKQSCSFWLRVF